MPDKFLELGPTLRKFLKHLCNEDVVIGKVTKDSADALVKGFITKLNKETDVEVSG